MGKLKKFDYFVLNFVKKYHVLFARCAIFIVYFWFGALKLFNFSPASPMVDALLKRTLPFISFQQFIIIFALFEMAIGILFLIRGLERLAAAFLALHLFTTLLPLVFLTSMTWQGFFIPTMEGQYIIKNVLIIALGFVVLADIDFLEDKKNGGLS